MISLLLTDLKLADLNNFANVETATIEAACSELDATQLKRILRVYTNADEMFTQRYLHGSNQNIKTLVDIGKAIDDTPEQAEHMMNRLLSRETLYFRCLVEVYREWHKKSLVVERVAEREIERSALAAEREQMEQALTEVKVED
jgi:hypothetical protein